MTTEQSALPALDGFALSPQQAQSWGSWHAAGAGPGCHAIAAVLSDTNAQQVAQRLRMLIEEQEIFRTRFVRRAELREPLQVPEPYCADHLQMQCGDDGGADVRKRLWRHALASHIEAGIAAWSAALAGGELYLVLAVAPLAADARTLARLMQVAEGSARGGSDQPLQYPDVAAWLQEFSVADEGAVGRQFWRRQSAPAPARICFDNGAALPGSPGLGRAQRTLPEGLLPGLAQRAACDGVRVDDLAFASWLWMLRALCADDALPPCALVVDGVSAPELEAAFGPLERLLPFAPPTSFAPLTREGLTQVGAACDAMREYQECFRAGQDGSEARYAFRWLDLGALTARVEALAAPGARCRALGGVLLQDGCATLYLEYYPELMSQQAADCLLEQWQCLLEGVLDAPDGVPALRIGTGLQQRILALCSGRVCPLAPEDNVLAWMERELAAGAGGSIIDGAETLLTEVNARANRLARQLLADGIGKGALVGLHMARSCDFVLAMLAVIKSGAAYLPMDLDYPRERLEYMASHAQPALILSDGSAQLGFGAVRGASLAAMELQAAHWPDSNPGVALDGSDTAYVLYTSGSTGVPKGVVIGHGALFNHMRWMLDQLGFGSGDVFLQRTSSSFDASVWEYWAPLLTGARMVIARQDKTYELAHLIDLIDRHAVSVAQFVPSLLETLVDYPAFTEIASLRHVLVGGEALGISLKKKVFARMQVRLSNLYGPTEACIDATFQECGPHDGAEISIGAPIDNTRVCVLGPEGRLAGIGIAGELCIAGAGLFKGYLHGAAQTAEKTLVPPFSSELHYRTGDLGRLGLDGNIEYLGRIDQQVKLHGFRIELAEVDAVVTAGGARAVTVVSKGMLVTFVLGEADAEALLTHARRLLPAYMVPARIVQISAFPLMPNGKLDRAALCALAGAESVGAPFEAPRGATERLLAEIWAKVLRRAQVGADERFFAIGGDSIRSIQVVYEASLRGLAFSVMDVFKFQTVRALAAYLDSGAGVPPEEGAAHDNPAPAALRLRYADVYPATEMQRYMIERYEADVAATGVFHAQQAFMLTSAQLDLAALEKALASAANAPNFRTRFVLDGDDCYQVLGEAGEPQVAVVDLRALDDQAQRDTLRQRMAADRADRFDPYDPQRALLRIGLYLLAQDRVEVVLSNHHAVQDGWGNVEFMNRVTGHYQDLVQGRESPVRGADSVCKEFALMQHALLSDLQQADFWKCQVATFRAAPAWQALARGCAYTSESFELAPALAGALNRLGREHNLSAKAVFLCAYIEALCKLELDSVVALVTNGRNERLSDPFHAMGLFWNLMPLAAVLPQGDALARCEAIQQRLLDLEPYARFPLRRIEALAGRRHLASAGFNFVHFHNQKEGAGSVEFEGTHVLDNFGLPISLTVGVNREDHVSLLLQVDADLQQRANEFRTVLLTALGDLAVLAPSANP